MVEIISQARRGKRLSKRINDKCPYRQLRFCIANFTLSKVGSFLTFLN